MHKLTTITAALILIASLTAFITSARSAFFESPQAEITIEVEQELERVSGKNLPLGGQKRIEARSDIPRRLIIPALGIDANIQDVGISRRGNMAVPSNYSDVGWYRYRATPGEQGSAVLAGHFDNGAGFPAVFGEISNLAPGDKIYVVLKNDERQEFQVISVENYDYLNAPLDLIFNRTGGAYLTLITCAGEWLDESQVYDERTVVFAEKI
jgi:sortase A